MKKTCKDCKFCDRSAEGLKENMGLCRGSKPTTSMWQGASYAVWGVVDINLDWCGELEPFDD